MFENLDTSNIKGAPVIKLTVTFVKKCPSRNKTVIDDCVPNTLNLNL